jgi:hypothetical protein
MNEQEAKLHRKVNQALLDIKDKTGNSKTPNINQLNALYSTFIIAVGIGNKSDHKKAIDKLLTGLVLWEVENL